MFKGVLDQVLTVERCFFDYDPEKGPATANIVNGTQRIPDCLSALWLGQPTPPALSPKHRTSVEFQCRRCLRAQSLCQPVEPDIQPVSLAFEERCTPQDEVRVLWILSGARLVEIEEVHPAEPKKKGVRARSFVSTDRDKAALPNALSSLVDKVTFVNINNNS